MANAERIEHLDRRQQADEVAAEDHQDADMQQVGAPAQLPLAQKLRRAGFPGVLLAIEAQQAAKQENRQAQIGVPAEERAVDGFVHRSSPYAVASRTSRRPARI